MFYIPVRLRTQGAPLSAQAFQVLAIVAFGSAALAIALVFIAPMDGGRLGDPMGAFGVAGTLTVAGLVLRIAGDAVAGIYEVRDALREQLRKE